MTTRYSGWVDHLTIFMPLKAQSLNFRSIYPKTDRLNLNFALHMIRRLSRHFVMQPPSLQLRSRGRHILFLLLRVDPLQPEALAHLRVPLVEKHPLR